MPLTVGELESRYGDIEEQRAKVAEAQIKFLDELRALDRIVDADLAVNIYYPMVTAEDVIHHAKGKG